MDVNLSSIVELQTIPGVGPTLSMRIVERRPFLEHAELLQVPGIGPKRFASLIQYLNPLGGRSKAVHRSTITIEDAKSSASTPTESAQSTVVRSLPRHRTTRESKSVLDNVVVATPKHVRMDVNLVTVAALESLRGIGPTLSKRIAQNRPFATLDELVSVRGISSTLVQTLRQWLVVVHPAGTFSETSLASTAVSSLCLRLPRPLGPSTPPVLLATWNIRHLSKTRPTSSLRRIASVLSRFDIIALQEVRDVLVVKRICSLLDGFTFIVSGAAGSATSERLCFFYRKRFGFQTTEVATTLSSNAMARAPFVVKFLAPTTSFILVNVHVVFGKRQQRLNEMQSIQATLACLRSAYSGHVVLLGDFNLPPFDIGPIPGWLPILRPPHTTTIFNNLYDNIWVPSFDGVSASGVLRIDHEFYPDSKHCHYASTRAIEARRACNEDLSDHCPVYVALTEFNE